MKKSSPILLSVTLLLIASMACALPAAPTQDISAMGTAIMQTMVSGVSQTAGAVVPVDIVNPISTLTVEVPTATQIPMATLSPTPIFTFTPLVPQISVSVATNCRVGPGKVYDRVGALLVGQVAEVVGRDLNGNYWYIRNPNQSNGFCWLWGEFATVTGNFSVLPVYTPPPTPTPMPAFEAEYDGKDTCVGWWVEILLTNTGGISFKSISLTVRDTTNDIVLSMYSDTFTDVDGCLNSSSKDSLNPGADRTISAPPFAYDPSGHQLRATITLCSAVGQNGTCLTDVIKFTP